MKASTATPQQADSSTSPSLTRGTAIAAMPHDRHARSITKGVGLSIATLAVYCGLVAATLLVDEWWLKIILAPATGLQIGILLVVAHDACHGSLTPRGPLNRFIATMFLLPAWHPYSSWKHTHNGIHHGWTNVRGKEIVYVPFSLSEFEALPRWRRLAERLFRTAPGLCFFYLCTVYPLHELFPNRARAPKGRQYVAFQWERILVLAFIVGQVALAIAVASWSGRHMLLEVAAAAILPTPFFFAAFGTVTFLHHTHPKAPWFNESDLEHYDILQATVHVELPRPIEWLLLEIVQHTAHHADARVPLYNLSRVQLALERTFPEIVHEPFTFDGYFRTIRTCRLFDYENHRWLDWDGTPLTPPLLPPKPVSTAARAEAAPAALEMAASA